MRKESSSRAPSYWPGERLPSEGSCLLTGGTVGHIRGSCANSERGSPHGHTAWVDSVEVPQPPSSKWQRQYCSERSFVTCPASLSSFGFH